LGFVHTGKQHAFVYDIADLYKAELTIPLAFSLHASTNPESDARKHFRDGLVMSQLMQRVVGDIQVLLDPAAKTYIPEASEGVTHLWDPETGAVPAAHNYGFQEET
jgi:CRISPR-associated protein Cas1